MAFAANTSQISVFNSNADLSAAASQFKLVKLHTVEGEVVACAAITDVAVGILENKPKAGERALVTDLHAGGIAKVRIGASQTVAIGDKIGPGTDGKGVVTTTSGHFAIGYALSAETTGAGNEAVISVLLNPHFVP